MSYCVSWSFGRKAMQSDHVTMGANGRMIIPAGIHNRIGMLQGGSFVIHVENGEVRLEPIAHAIARVQSLVREYVPSDVSLAGELSGDRRSEAERE
jgi:bifunctional DNA-binding transcriptional regulator/antitoxin component of YhaV-PrlF toxin-antitoxin module